MGGQRYRLHLLLLCLAAPAAHALKKFGPEKTEAEEPKIIGTQMVGPSCAADMKEPQQRASARQYFNMKPLPSDKSASGTMQMRHIDLLDKFVLHAGHMHDECGEELGNATEEDCHKPLVSYLGSTVIKNAFCYFNFYPETTYYWKQSWMYDPQVYGWSDARRALFAAKQNPHGIDTDRIKLASGVDLLGGAICLDNGYLDMPMDTLYNNPKLDAVALNHCEELKGEFPDYAELPLAQAVADKAEIINSLKNGTSPSPQIARRYELLKCMIGMVATRMQIVSCKYSFCKLADDRIGMGQQCNKNWMTTWMSPNSTRFKLLSMSASGRNKGRFEKFTMTAQEYLTMFKTGKKPPGVVDHPEGDVLIDGGNILEG